jgi:hypothetical protein
MLNTSKIENIKLKMKRLVINIQGVSKVKWLGNGDFWSDYQIIYSGDEKPGGLMFIVFML